MKKLISPAIFLALLSSGAFAAMTAKDVPNSPPPYGAYYVESSRMSNAESRARQEAVAKHYGYPNLMEANAACMKVSGASNFKYNCVKDGLAHKRDSDPVAAVEIKKYGFKNWQDAVEKCESKIERGDVIHCKWDPFLKLRRK